MKLPLPDGAGNWDDIRNAAARAKNPAWDNKQLIANLMAFVDRWHAEGCPAYSLDSRVFVKSATSLRQDFFNVRNALRNNPAMMEYVTELTGPRRDTLLAALDDMRFRVKDEFLLIHRGLDQAVDNPFLAAARPITAMAKRTLRSRLTDWLDGDMEQPFEATGESIDDDLESQIRLMLSAYDDKIAYAVTSSSVLARKL